MTSELLSIMNVFVASPSEQCEFYLKMLSDRNPTIRKKAAQTLGKIGEKSCLVQLKVQLEQEEDAGVRQAIEKAIYLVSDSGEMVQ